MSELINNSSNRKARLKELILKLHDGVSEAEIRQELLDTLSSIPYDEVVEVEQELISQGLPVEEVLRLCDAHSAVLQGNIDLSTAKEIPTGHPIDVFIKENEELRKTTGRANQLLKELQQDSIADFDAMLLELRGLFNALMDVDKHYQRKEFLLFPSLR